MKEKTCDYCGQTFPESYFCPKCSNQYFEEEVERTMDELPMWDGDSRFANYPILVTEADVTGNVCYNCCNCR